MEMLAYIALAVVLYSLLADRTDRAIEREMRNRRTGTPDLRLVEDVDGDASGREDLYTSSVGAPPT